MIPIEVEKKQKFCFHHNPSLIFLMGEMKGTV